MTPTIPSALAALAKSRGAQGVVSAYPCGCFSVQLRTRSATGDPIYIRVNESGEQRRVCAVSGAQQEPLHSIAEVWPIEAGGEGSVRS